jgi:trehalose 6-phosphate phosphatase
MTARSFDQPDRPSFPDRGSASLLFDLDGTLLPIRPTPGEVSADDGDIDLVSGLVSRFGGRLAVLSGRPIADIDRILRRAVETVAGIHGLEIRRGGETRRPHATHPGLAPVRAAFARFAEGTPGALVEDKGLSLALHYREAPGSAADAARLARDLADETGLVLQRGSMVEELRTPGADKGDALRAIMAEPPFAGTAPWYFGDDLTDEDGFRAAAALGGAGVLVGPRRTTAARWRLPDIDALRDWLREGLLEVRGSRVRWTA